MTGRESLNAGRQWDSWREPSEELNMSGERKNREKSTKNAHCHRECAPTRGAFYAHCRQHKSCSASSHFGIRRFVCQKQTFFFMEGRSVFDKLFDDRIKTLFVATTADLCECQAGIRLEIFVVPGAFDLDDYGAAVKRILDDDIRSAVAEFHIGSDSSVAHRQHADQKSVVVLFSLVKNN
ncbi:MAG: hypothetical protein SPJ12_02860 [Duodenibacillus sp.]|nr:hypothetical protein [Duodenibacillus sp.]